MKKSKLIILSFYLIAHLNAYGQGINYIRGTLLDAENNEAVAFAGIGILGTNYSTISDADGNFKISARNLSDIQLLVNSVGYVPETLKVKNIDKPLIIKLKYDTKQLEEVIVKPGKVKYKRKNNPAVELIEKVIDHKKENRKEALDFYQNEKYEKVIFALSNLSEEFKSRKILKSFRFVFENRDTSKISGIEILPVFMKENISSFYYRKDPKSKKEYIKASQMVNFEGVDKQGLTDYLKYLYQDINIYDNNISFLTNQFVSPVAPTAPLLYRYYIMDTVEVEGSECIRLFFSPRNKTDMLFQGDLFILKDSTYAIKKISLSVNPQINLNWVKDVKICQTFNKTESGWMLTTDDIAIDFGITKKGMGIFGQKTISYKDYIFDSINDTVFSGEEIVELNGSEKYDSTFWKDNRHNELSKSESNTYVVMDSVKNVPAFKRTVDIMSLLVYGYKDVGFFEVGPVNTFYSYNPVEGNRYRFGGRTTVLFSKKIFLEGYLAYGFLDEKYKYYGSATLSLTPRSIYEFPIKYIRVSYQNDTKVPGQDLQYIHEDNILLSLRRGPNDKMFYNKIFRIEHLNEFKNHFSYNLSYMYNEQAPAGNLYFNYTDYLQHVNNIPRINVSEISVNLRFAPKEQFYQGKIYRTAFANAYPIFELQYTLGNKLIMNDYNYHKLKFSIYKRFYLSMFGYTDVLWESGKVFGHLPYPLLIIHRANQTYSYQSLSYNMMNFLEFISDQYTSLNIDHSFNGLIFNKVPLFRRLKLREVATLKILYGNVTRENDPMYHSDLFRFPLDVDGSPLSYTLEQKPYIEGSVGVANIFKVIRIDVVKRFTYLGHKNVSEIGIRAKFKFDF